MISLSKNSKNTNHRPWRRRISNQLAAFAAIMLFASTQVGDAESGLDMNSVNPQIASQSVLSDINTPQLELSATLDKTGSDTSRKTSSTKKKSFKFNLFRFRH